MPSGGNENLLATALAIVDEILPHLSRRHGLDADATEEFASRLKLKLLDDDCAVLRAFRGESSLKTYLNVVAQRLFLDEQISEWGKWRPSAAAKRLGPLAVELDMLLHRDRRDPEQAVQTMLARHPGVVTRSEIESLASEIVRHTMRLHGPPVPLSPEHARANDTGESRFEREELADQVSTRVGRAFVGLSPEDRWILRARFRDGLTVASLARVLGADQKSLYRRIERLLQHLRLELEQAGIRRLDTAALIGRSDVEFTFGLENDAEN